MNKIYLAFLTLVGLSFSFAYADNEQVGASQNKPIMFNSCQFKAPDNDNPCIVQDLPFHNYRHPSMFKGNPEGLSKLLMSGSAQPDANPKTWQKIKQAAGLHKIYDIDLRQESHGFIDDQPISLVGADNQLNLPLGPNPAAVLKVEHRWLTSLKNYSAIQYVWKKTSQSTAQQEIMLIHTIKDEAQVAKVYGLHYVRVALRDRHMLVTKQDVKQIVKLMRKADQEGAWIHWHCREGQGRTSTVMIMDDIYHNADKVSFKDIIARETSIEPKFDFSKHADILHFLQDFYHDVKAGKYAN
jgi:hypothetical protein